MSTISQFFRGGPGQIKSIQRGTLVVNYNQSSAFATITAVDTSKSILYFLGYSTSSVVSGTRSEDINRSAYLTLTNSTTITASGANFYANLSQDLVVSWQLVEYY